MGGKNDSMLQIQEIEKFIKINEQKLINIQKNLEIYKKHILNLEWIKPKIRYE